MKGRRKRGREGMKEEGRAEGGGHSALNKGWWERRGEIVGWSTMNLMGLTVLHG